MKKRRIYLIAGAFALYAVLLVLLVQFEGQAADASILSYWDAIWFAIVTLTTVGYGDMGPVTTAGRIIGILLVLSSLGLLSAIISGMVALFSGYMFPLAKLKRCAGRPWYVFLGGTEEAAVLSANIRSRQPEAVTIFCAGQESDKVTLQQDADKNVFFLSASPAWLYRQKHSDDIRFFCFGENGWANMAQAAALAEETGAPVYCAAPAAADNRHNNLTFFDRDDSVGRQYWERYPMKAGEHTVILIGCGKIGEKVLERGLLVNVFGPEHTVRYIVVGESDAFRRTHHVLCEKETGKSLDFRPSFAALTAAELRDADRIILAMDDAGENLALCHTLREYYILHGAVHMKYSGAYVPEGVALFGHPAEIFTPEYVMQEQRNRLAIRINELYRQSVGGNAPSWEELSNFHRQSNIAAADHLYVKIRILLGDAETDRILTEQGEQALFRRAYEAALEQRKDAVQADAMRRIEHERWIRFHEMYNWRYAPVRDNANRLHPLLRPFETLPEADRIKDDAAWDVLKDL